MGTMLLKIKLNLIKSHLHKEVARSKENTMYSEKILITRIPMLKLPKKSRKTKSIKLYLPWTTRAAIHFVYTIFEEKKSGRNL